MCTAGASRRRLCRAGLAPCSKRCRPDHAHVRQHLQCIVHRELLGCTLSFSCADKAATHALYRYYENIISRGKTKSTWRIWAEPCVALACSYARTRCFQMRSGMCLPPLAHACRATGSPATGQSTKLQV
jgi:hypothetical protein